MIVNVANGPGVSSVISAANLPALPALVASDGFGIAGLTSSAWGIYENGEPVVTADTVVAVVYKQEFAVSDYPIEQGGFESYDKVQIPFDVRMRLVAGGSLSAVQTLIDSAQAVAASMSYDYQVVTPEKVYSSCTCTHQDYQRLEGSGTNMVMIEMWFLEIRATAAASGATTPAASSASPNSDGGDVQASSITAQNAASSGLAYDSSGNVSFPNSQGAPAGSSFQIPGLVQPSFGQVSPFPSPQPAYSP